jgi:hypothetical protein
MFKTIEKALGIWITFIIFIPTLSWVIMLTIMMALQIRVELLCLNNGFAIWLSSLVTAYGFYLYKLTKD